jgi:phage baseplate assembly protein W
VPLQNISRGFKDISLSFAQHPVTKDILALKNADAIKRSVQNLIRIRIGEVFFNNLIGTKIEDSLFELASQNFLDPIKSEIETVIQNNEPRVKLNDVIVESNSNSNELLITISYDIIGLQIPNQQITFVLESTRP